MDPEKLKKFIEKIEDFKEKADKLIRRDAEGGREITLELFPEYEEISMEIEKLIKEIKEEIK